MKRNSFTAEQIVTKLKQVEVLMAQISWPLAPGIVGWG